MPTSPYQLYQYAALAEWMYARNSADQPTQLSEIGAGNTIAVDDFFVATNPNPGLTLAGDKYYSERGFVGTVIQQGVGENAKYIVVLRGSDWGSADPLSTLPTRVDGMVVEFADEGADFPSPLFEADEYFYTEFHFGLD
jgi:hypothetical protein